MGSRQAVLRRSGAGALCCIALLASAAGAEAGIRTFDSQGQEIDYGCDLSHPDGQGWVCYDATPNPTTLPPEMQAVKPPIASLARHRKGRQPQARVANTYNWSFNQSGEYGIGSTLVGQLQTVASISFNGRQGRVNSSQQVLHGPAVRIDFRADAYHDDSALTWADGIRAILPSAPSVTTARISMPQWLPYFHGIAYFLSWNWYVRASGVNNPSSADGTFHAGPIHSPTFHCVDSLGSCYF